jgi:hypothetical protein
MDNLNTHYRCSLYEAFEPFEAKRLADKLEIHSKHGSWLNMAEIELSHYDCIKKQIVHQPSGIPFRGRIQRFY